MITKNLTNGRLLFSFVVLLILWTLAFKYDLIWISEKHGKTYKRLNHIEQRLDSLEKNETNQAEAVTK